MNQFNLGILLIAVGVILRVLAVRELSKYDAWSNVPQMPTEIVTTGIYRVSNHPAYTGSLLIFLGAFLAVPMQHRYLVEMLLIAVIYQNRIEFENHLKKQL